MAYFLHQGSYTAEAWSAMLKNPQDRTQAIQGVAQKLGGSIERIWLAFGDCDVIVVGQMPDNVSAAAFSMAVAAGGALKSVKTTPLMTMAEAQDAMRKGASCGYEPVTRRATAAA